MRSLNSALAAVLSLPLAQLVRGQIFTVNCQPLSIQRADPILFPGIVSPHVHAVIGGTGFNQTETAETATSSNDTTCDRKLDHSNYWQPQLYHQRTDGGFDLVTFQGSVSIVAKLAYFLSAYILNSVNKVYLGCILLEPSL
jgi:hypothetical protein